MSLKWRLRLRELTCWSSNTINRPHQGRALRPRRAGGVNRACPKARVLESLSAIFVEFQAFFDKVTDEVADKGSESERLRQALNKRAYFFFSSLFVFAEALFSAL